MARMRLPAFQNPPDFIDAWLGRGEDDFTLLEASREDPAGFLKASAAAFRAGATLPGERLEPYARAVPDMATWLWTALYDDRTPDEAKVECVRACGEIVARICSMEGEFGSSCGGFWQLMFYPPPEEVESLGTPLADALREVLLAQLELPNENCQFSALFGLEALNDPTTKEPIAHFRDRTDDPELKDYADRLVRWFALR